MSRKNGWERIGGGLIALGAFGLVAYLKLLPPAVAIVLAILFGLLPVLGGVRRLISNASELRQEKREALELRLQREQRSRDGLEKTILKIARERGGVVSPAHIVLNSDVKLEDAEKALGDLAARGYAEMRVKDNGTIDYVFHDLT